LIGVAFVIPAVFPSLFPSKLRTRAQIVGDAWLARDAEQIRSYTEPSLADNVPIWLESNPLPELNGQGTKPVVDVSVRRNDGRSAEVMIQITGTRPNGAQAQYIYLHRWVSRDGAWYVQPGVRASTTATAAAKSGPDNKRPLSVRRPYGVDDD